MGFEGGFIEGEKWKGKVRISFGNDKDTTQIKHGFAFSSVNVCCQSVSYLRVGQSGVLLGDNWRSCGGKLG